MATLWVTGYMQTFSSKILMWIRMTPTTLWWRISPSTTIKSRVVECREALLGQESISSGTCSALINRDATGIAYVERTTGCRNHSRPNVGTVVTTATIGLFPRFQCAYLLVFKSWVTKGDVVRMAIHTSLRLPTNQQLIIYTPTFRVEE
jgi:hypothetical protein